MKTRLVVDDELGVPHRYVAHGHPALIAPQYVRQLNSYLLDYDAKADGLGKGRD